jgi:hypothetical protein
MIMTPLLKSFAAFVLSNRRPDRVYTLSSLLKAGYTGPVYIVVDDEDPTLPEYLAKHGDRVVVFNKAAIAKTFDLADNFHAKRGAVVFARNAVFQIARELGIKYFVQLDDDYTEFAYKFDGQGLYRARRIRSLDKVFATMVKFLEVSRADTVCMAQGGDFIGGAESRYGQAMLLLRKAMNTFVCCTDRPFSFVGRINEDVNTYVTRGMRGRLMLTVNPVAITQKQTQSNAGGMTGTYLAEGTYFKSFYTVMMAPSCVKVSRMGEKHRRIHHKIRWRYAVPKILDATLRKEERTG